MDWSADLGPLAGRQPVPGLHVGLLLLLPYRAMETRVFEGLAAAGFADLTPAQARVFARIAPGSSRLTDLAAQAGITKQSAGFLVDQLESGGYVDRVPGPAGSPQRGGLARDRGPGGGRVDRLPRRAPDDAAPAHPYLARSPTPGVIG